MPSIYTHDHFSKDVYKELNNKYNFDLETYLIFSQSFDYLYYYHFYSPFYGKKIRRYGRYFHRHNTQDYLINIIQYIKDYKINDKYILGYLYGSINHYVLDSTMHPFINYLSKEKNNLGNHTQIEFNIDAYYCYKDTNTSITNYRIDKNIIKKYVPSKNLLQCMNETFYKTYNKNNLAKKYFAGYNNGRFIFKWVLFDKTGIKKKILKIIDKIFLIKKAPLANYSLYIPTINYNFLNKENKTWHKINDKNYNCNKSWDELYNEAIKKSIKIINASNKYFNNKLSLTDLKKEIPNITYSNGDIIK